MEIYRFDPRCKEWEDIRNSNLVGSKKEMALKDCVRKIGTRLTLEEYFSIPSRKNNWMIGVCYECVGEPNNILEELAYGEIEYSEELYYCHMSEDCPEDLIESRTDWNTLKGYADDLAQFIERLKNEIGTGKLKFE